MNATMMANIVDDAEHIYCQERFLREVRPRRSDTDALAHAKDSSGDDPDVISLAEIVEESDKDEPLELEASSVEDKPAELEPR